MTCPSGKHHSEETTNLHIFSAVRATPGSGPLTGAEEIRYSRIGTTSAGVVFDLVITALSQYESKLPNPSGLTNAFGILNMLPAGAGSFVPPTVRPSAASFSGTTDFKFSFMSPGTNTPVVVSEVHMAIFDLDKEGFTGSTEIGSSKGYRGYVTDVAPTVVASRLDDGRTKFTAALANIPNPTDPNALTTAQRRNAVMYFYKDVSSGDLRPCLNADFLKKLFLGQFEQMTFANFIFFENRGLFSISFEKQKPTPRAGAWDPGPGPGGGGPGPWGGRVGSFFKQVWKHFFFKDFRNDPKPVSKLAQNQNFQNFTIS
jgi:hypothetical protein